MPGQQTIDDGIKMATGSLYLIQGSLGVTLSTGSGSQSWMSWHRAH